MNNENKFILELCKLKADNKKVLTELMDKGLDYPYILGHLLYNRLGGIAYYKLREYELLGNMNREFRNTLLSIYEGNVLKSQSLLYSLDDISSVCKSFSFDYAALKGSYLVSLYPIGLRTSNDIDFLVKSSNTTGICTALKNAGFKQGNVKNNQFVPATRSEIVSSRMNRGETVPFIKEVNYPGMKYLEIDVNFSLGFKPDADENMISKMLASTEPNIVGGINTLSNIDFFIHLCAHLHKEATVLNWVIMERDVSLYKYCDLYLFITSVLNKSEMATLTNRVRELGLEKEVYYAMHYTKELFDLDNEALMDVLQQLRPTSINYLKEIISPANGKVYEFNIPYREWVFSKNRKELLYEIRNDET